jgi:hypothetical protein
LNFNTFGINGFTDKIGLLAYLIASSSATHIPFNTLYFQKWWAFGGFGMKF